MESQRGYIELGEEYIAKEGALWARAALEGSMPTLTISATVTLGSLTLRTS